MIGQSFFVFDLPVLTLKDFLDKQKAQIAAVMSAIRGEWYESILKVNIVIKLEPMYCVLVYYYTYL